MTGIMQSNQNKIQKLFIITLAFSAFSSAVWAQDSIESASQNTKEEQQSSVQSTLENTSITRNYTITLGYPHDSRVIANAGVALNKAGYDLYFQLVYPKLPGLLQKITAPVWTTFWTFNFTLWPHEMGHWVRANQAGGDFLITQYQFPVPVAKMVQPPWGATPLQEALMSSGGFEINNLMRRQTEMDFYKHGYAYGDELAHSFIQSIFFPMYSVLFTPADPENPETWSNAYGDPTQYTKIIFEHYSGRPSVANNEVDPEQAKMYKEFFWVNLATILLDPMLYQSAAGFGMDMALYETRRPWRLGNETFSWMYSLQFNPGALGYEIIFLNHVKIKERKFAFYGKWGRPFKNYGAGILYPQIFTMGKFSMGSSLEVWEQDFYGQGISLSVIPAFEIVPGYQLLADVSWKTQGYILGRRLEEGPEFLLHLAISF